MKDVKYDTLIRTGIGLAKESFQMFSNVLRNGNISEETNKLVLGCYGLSNLVHGSGPLTTAPRIRRKVWAAEMWFYRI